MSSTTLKHKLIDVESYENAWLKLKREDVEDAKNPFKGGREEDLHMRVLRIMQNPDYFRWTVSVLLDIELLPEQVVVLRELWNHSFPMYIASRGFGKSFLLAVYAVLRCILIPETKVVIVGSAFRQSKVIFEYMDTIWRNAPILQSLCSDSSGPRRDVDKCTLKINDSWAMAVPLGDGQKIRGLRAHTIIADEFNSIPVEIYETVVAGFTAVSPKPAQNVQQAARRSAMKDDGVWSETNEVVYKDTRHANQSILSGTAGYDFEPFADYWKKYKSQILNRGSLKHLIEEFGDEESIPDFLKNLSWENFAIIRIPYELIPEGFMDDQQVARARATMHAGIYEMEYGACFAKDSQGFFKRTVIQGCVATEKNIGLATWPRHLCPEPFDVTTKGDPSKGYVYGIDPASERDNFAIIILELHEAHQRLVYSWTTNKKDFLNRKLLGLTDSSDYYSFCVRKIRDLMKSFPCVQLGIDAQGGGFAIAEGLRDPDKMEQGELPILEIIEEDKAKPTDDLPGLHILEFAQFARADWNSQANHGLRKDMEDKVLLFPRFDTLSVSLYSEKDKVMFDQAADRFNSLYGDNSKTKKVSMVEARKHAKLLRIYDGLEDIAMDIEELKDELSTIIVSRSNIGGRERFDTPEVKLGTGKKGRMRKDRYSAMVIANMIARKLHRIISAPQFSVVGKVATNSGNRKRSVGEAYKGPAWATDINANIFRVIKR